MQFSLSLLCTASLLSYFDLVLSEVPTNSSSNIRNETLPVLGGVDVVSYFNTGRAAWGNLSIVGHLVTDEGRPLQTTELVSYPFLFESEENRAQFLSDPWKFAPAYGGFCAFGIAYERKSGQSGQPWAPDWCVVLLAISMLWLSFSSYLRCRSPSLVSFKNRQ